MPSAHEHLSAQFYEWERRGRGWQVHQEPVSLEPPFEPFALRSIADAEVIDDGRRPTFLSSLFRGLTAPPAVPPQIPPKPEEAKIEPRVREEIVELQVSLPADLDVASDSFEQMFRNLSLCREPIAFELLGTHRKVVAQFAACPSDISVVRRQLRAHFPDAQFREVPDALKQAVIESQGDEIFVVEFGLESEFMLPLATGKLDPFIGIVSSMAELQAGELALLQILWQPIGSEWAESIVDSVTRPDGKPLFVNQARLTDAAKDKVSKPLYAVVVRMMIRGATRERLTAIAREFAGSLRSYADPLGNALIPLHNDDYDFIRHIEDTLLRQSRRSGMILNGDELTGFVHLPSEAVNCEALLRVSGKTKAAPDNVRHDSGFCLGDNEHNGAVVPVYLNPDQRTRHTHIIGSIGGGKTTLLFNLIRQDIESDQGVAVFDPHGDLIDQLLSIIPHHRINDVIYFDPSDEDFPVGFNILHAHTKEEKILLASDLIGVFRRFASSWGDTMDTIMLNAILAFVENERTGTLADLRDFLQNEKFRHGFLQTATDPEIKRFWTELFPELGGKKSVMSVLMRLQDFFSRKPLRNIVSQRSNKLNFADIMDTGKIFLARLPEGLNGSENTHLLGTLLISKFQQLAMARQAQEADERRNFWIYVDEFDEFIAPSLEKILKGARKYRIGLTLAHQQLHQLSGDPKVESAVLTQPCTRIVFHVGDSDAKKLGEGFAFFDDKAIKNLEKYHALARVERNDCDFNLATRDPDVPPLKETKAWRDKIIARSRARYATLRKEVEAAWSSHLPSPPVANKPVSEPPPVTKAAEPEKAKVPEPAESAVRGERRHGALKKEITAVAETLGYTVESERFIPPHGQVDLVLTRGEQSIACEISDTTPPEVEADHIHKRLEAGFKHVAVISDSSKKLNQIREAHSGKKAGDLRAAFYSPKQFLDKLYEWAVKDPVGGIQERNKNKKQIFNLSPDGKNQSLSNEAMLKEIAERMKADRRKPKS